MNNPRKHSFVSKQLQTFFYWIKERHRVYTLRQKGQLRPWSDDPVMQTVFFTNPYRENDKVTVWFRKNIRDSLYNSPEVFFATVAFRRFNSIQTGEVILDRNLHKVWNKQIAYNAIKEMTRVRNLPYLSAAYMIAAPPGTEKLEFLCQCNSEIYRSREYHVENLLNCETLEEGWKYLTRFRNVGPFIGYEWITDLRHTYLFNKAPDIMTWCAFGPGALRGLNRLLGNGPVRRIPSGALDLARELLALAHQSDSLKGMPKLEMREIEHSLCEFDKYQRVAEGGKPKRWYNGAPTPVPE